MNLSFADHFSGVASAYADARPEYPDALFAWIAEMAPSPAAAWEAGCGSGQASRGLAAHFDRVFATDPAAAQIAHATGPDNVTFAIEGAERCSLGDASVDAVCVAQALHWFDRDAFFAQCERVLKPGGLLVAWGYQDIVVEPGLAAANASLQHDIAAYWPTERALIDAAYADFAWPFATIPVPGFKLEAQWPLPRLLGYFASYSATRRYRDATGRDPVAQHADGFASALGNDLDAIVSVRWPLFVHARRKAS
jgi:SAM-dependent methyltransferase